MRRHMTYANVVATLALVVAVGGGSTAIAISAKKAPKNSVTTKSIRDGSVTGKDLAGVRYENQLGGSTGQELRCLPGERLLTGGAAGSGQLNGFGPTPDGDGYARSSSTGGGAVSVLCLKATPGK